MTTTRRSFIQQTAALGAVTGFAAGKAIAATSPHARSHPFSAARRREPMRLLILGGTGFLGPAVVEYALECGHIVTLFNRGRTNPDLFADLETRIGDRDPNVNDGLSALEEGEWDAVVDTSGYVPRIVRASAQLLAPRVKHYTFISSASVYAANNEPHMDETAPVGRLDDPTIEQVTNSTFGPLKALCEEAAEAAMPGRVQNIRPGLIVGPRDNTDRFSYWPVRISRGGTVLAPPAQDPVQFIDVRDLARFIVDSAEHRIAGVFNTMGPERTCTVERLLDACQRMSGAEVEFVHADHGFLREHRVNGWSDLPVWVAPVGGSAGFTRRDFSKAVEAGLRHTRVEDTVLATLNWYRTLPEARQQRLRAGISAEREAEVLAAWQARPGDA